MNHPIEAESAAEHVANCLAAINAYTSTHTASELPHDAWVLFVSIATRLRAALTDLDAHATMPQLPRSGLTNADR